MKSSHVIRLFMLTAMLLFPVTGKAVEAPHNYDLTATPPRNFSCAQCHLNGRSAGLKRLNNLCYNCHQYSSNVDYPLTVGDSSNVFNTVTTSAYKSLSEANKKMTTHNWVGKENNPAAGAVTLTTASLLYKIAVNGTVSCARCHWIHSSGVLYQQNKPLLRMANDKDQMCFECHQTRNTRTHTAGSHPVGFSYASSAALNPAKLNPAPSNANPSNPTSNLGNYLKYGRVVCSTCHNIHKADSNSATYDSYSTGRLSPPASTREGKGMLLRTDMRGAAANNINICTNCHTGKLAHNNKGQNVQCADCHAGHVDYDPLDPTGALGKNVYLVRRYMNITSSYGAVRNKRAFYRYTGAATSEFKRADGTGVCQACHVVPTGGSYPAQHSLVTAGKSDCGSCHSHYGTIGSFSGGCTTCHGFPPKNNVGGGPNGYAVNGAKNYNTSGVFKNESTAGHPSHAGNSPYSFVCNECHKGNAHDSGTFQDVFIDKTGIIASTGGANPTYAGAGSGTCSTSYCHSNGAPRGGTLKYKSVTWASSRKTIVGTANECAACHNGVFATFNNLSTNAHFRHVSNNVSTGKGYGCVVCHAATVSGNTAVSSTTNHVNGVKNISFSGTPANGTTWDGVGATCSTSACHGDGKGGAAVTTPVWTNRNSGKCGNCHYTTPTIGGAAVISTGGHFAHFSSSAVSYGPMLTQKNTTSCATCHTYNGELDANHVNGTINVALANCTLNCHKQLAAINPAWTAGPVACESCHTGTLSVINGLTAPDKGAAATSGHGKPAGANKACLDCHDRNKRHISNKAGDNTRLLNALIGTLNTECNYCHNNQAQVANGAFRNMTTHVVIKGGGQAMACFQCHDPHGSGNLSMIKAKIAYINSTSWTITYTDRSTQWVNTVTNRGLCQVCHRFTAHYRAGVPESNHPTTNCFNCHSHRAGGAAFKPKGDCDSCHGYPPMPRNVAVTFGIMNNWSSARFEDYSGGGGAHAVAAHIPKTAKKSQGWANCAICHNSGNTASTPNHVMNTPVKSNVANLTVALDPKYKFSASAMSIYSGEKLVNPPQANKSGSCSNLSCHFGSSLKWSTEK